jgi:hypothetical protein
MCTALIDFSGGGSFGPSDARVGGTPGFCLCVQKKISKTFNQ